MGGWWTDWAGKKASRQKTKLKAGNKTVRKEQSEACLSKKSVTLSPLWSSARYAEVCKCSKLTCASAATTAAHHIRPVCPVSASQCHFVFCRFSRWGSLCWCSLPYRPPFVFVPPLKKNMTNKNEWLRKHSCNTFGAKVQMEKKQSKMILFNIWNNKT